MVGALRLSAAAAGLALGLCAIGLCVTVASAQIGAAKTFRDCATCPEMVQVPGGRFLMGSLPGVGDEDEHPQHEVTVPAFAVGKYEVTFDEWDACVADGGCGGYWPPDEGWGRGKRPVIHVSWNDAKTYVAWLSRKTGKTYRLLSEAEWEYANRAGSTTVYWTGANITPAQANYDSMKTVPVGSYAPNPFGLSDMVGNVWEWTEDCWNDSYAGAPANGAAWTSGDCTQRVRRGGAWRNPIGGARSANRGMTPAGAREFEVGGIRVARTN